LKRWVAIGATALGIAAAAATPAMAGDGVYEINQACAAAGCFPNDSPGFPVNGTVVGGSYKLTSDLVVPDANTWAVAIPQAATLDLNGFAIRGPTSCTGVPAVCTGAGTGSGVGVGASGTVRNGTIRGMGDKGISGDDGVRVENVQIESNGGDGIKGYYGSEGWYISDSSIQHNGGDGIDLNGGAPKGTLIVHNSIYGNAGFGVQGTGLSMLGNMVDSNASYGLNANMGSGQATLGQNTFFNNNGGNANTQKLGGQSLGGNYCGTSSC
jgi:hypothetical protein